MLSLLVLSLLLPQSHDAQVSPVALAQRTGHIGSLERRPVGLGIQSALRAAGDRFAAYSVVETDEDLNGDGDTRDRLTGFVHLRSGRRNDRFLQERTGQGGPLPIVVSEDLFAISLQEVQEDFNGDGDTNDSVLHLYEPRSDKLTNLGVAARNYALTPSFLVALVEEFRHGADLNLDGDSRDEVLHVIDLDDLSSRFLDPAVISYHATDKWIFYSTWEASGLISTDYNGDGDTDDYPLFVVPTRGGPSRLLTSNGMSPVLAGDLLYFIVAEDWAGQDLNLDGDTFDRVLHVAELATGQVRCLKIAVFPPSTSSSHFTASPAGFAACVEEYWQDADLNGDGDLLDRVVAVGSREMGEVRFLEATAGPVQRAGNRIGYLADEAAEARDLNGDGDTNDSVLQLFDLLLAQPMNTGLASSSFKLEEELVAVRVRELGQGADLNGDSDLTDNILHTVDPATGTVSNVMEETGSASLAFVDDLLYFVQSEASLGIDLTTDGDRVDTVLGRVELPTGRVTRFDFPTRGTLISSKGRLFFSIFEGDWDRDLSGDGDFLDSVLHFLR